MKLPSRKKGTGGRRKKGPMKKRISGRKKRGRHLKGDGSVRISQQHDVTKEKKNHKSPILTLGKGKSLGKAEEGRRGGMGGHLIRKEKRDGGERGGASGETKGESSKGHSYLVGGCRRAISPKKRRTIKKKEKKPKKTRLNPQYWGLTEAGGKSKEGQIHIAILRKGGGCFLKEEEGH